MTDSAAPADYDTAMVRRLLRQRRTISQASLSKSLEPDHRKVVEAIGSAIWAPNHHLTEPWRFYILDRDRISALGEIWAAVLTRGGSSEQKVEHKRREWGESRGILILTCTSVPEADEVMQLEDFAACCCAAQNLMLHLWSEGIGSKWSTAAVHEHEDFWPLLGHAARPQGTRLVGSFFYGVPERIPPGRREKGFADVAVNFRDG